ncbi:MAG: hypothetical protein DI539_26665 [Flavobacterium psychrophilum]|nr:MAG: hypothetical protein DI539_26665 [Flavobacterium psychrophilum]
MISVYLLSCEKDDICSEDIPTTPGLVVQFHNKEIPTDTLVVSNFRYYVLGSNEVLPANPSAGVYKITLPLRTDQDEVTWALQYNSTSPITGVISTNTDYLTIKYTRKNTYVSRACGYKTTFVLNPATSGNPNPSVTDADATPFIDGNPEVVTPYIENENEVHVKIYF